MRVSVIPIAALALLLLAAASAGAKEGRTLFTAERLAALRDNLECQAWARQQRDTIVKRCEPWLARDDTATLALVPPPAIPRDAYVSVVGCPVHGLEIHKFGTYPWIVSLDKPWQVQCPVGKEIYPSNDFGAYLAGGMKERGLLSGEHPDDGWGWKNPADGRKYWFVAYWNHWCLIHNGLMRALADLPLAYLMTGDTRYAHRTALILWQLAQYYPDYHYEKQSREGTEVNHSYYGKLLYHTWETRTVDAAARAYDAVFPTLESDTDLQRLAGTDGPGVRRAIEGRLLREMARLIMDGSHTIQGNFGMHQRALLNLAIVLGDGAGNPSRREMVDWVLDNPGGTLYTDASIRDALLNLVFRDGTPFESPGYNLGWVRDLSEVAELLSQSGVDLYAEPRFRRLFDWAPAMAIGGTMSPALGDSNNLFARVVGLEPGLYERAYRHTADPRHALVAAGNAGERDPFARPLDAEIARAATAARGVPGPAARLLPGYGVAVLQTGSTANRTALSLFYGRYYGHAHYDRLHLDLFSDNMALTPDFGYPETANSTDPRRYGFFSHTVAHNTVTVDARRQEERRGRLHALVDQPGFRMVDASAEGSYPDVPLYRRLLALVDATPDRAYVVDVFRARGGHQHDWIVHGTDADFRLVPGDGAGPVLSPPAQGTLAGPQVPYGRFYDDARLGSAPYGSVNYRPYMGSGFQFLLAPQRAPLAGPARVEWLLRRKKADYPFVETAGVALRAHLLSGTPEELIACDGRPQAKKPNPETVKFVLRRRTGDGLESTFVTLFEPYRNTPFVKHVARVPLSPDDGAAVAVRVELPERTDLFISALDGDREYRAGALRFRGEAGFLSLDAAGRVRRAVLHNGRLLSWGAWKVEGPGPRLAHVAAVDVAQGRVSLDAPVLRPEDAGRVVSTGNETHGAAVRIDRILDARTFHTDEDLRTGRAILKGIEGSTLLTPTILPLVEVGMTAVAADGRPLGRVVSVASGELTLAQPPEPAPAAAGVARFWLLDIGPGDEVRLPDLAVFEAE